jgi:hypothetical protein
MFEFRPANKPLHSLQNDTADRYAQMWGRWVVFVIRMYDLQVRKGDTRYPVHFNIEQKRCIDWAIVYCKSKKEEEEGRDGGSRVGSKNVLMEMARWFWRPNGVDDFDHMAEDEFSDPTVRFAALINLLNDGTFQSPRNATHNLVQVKYFMRIGLLMWSRDNVKKKGKPLARCVAFYSACIKHKLSICGCVVYMKTLLWRSPDGRWRPSTPFALLSATGRHMLQQAPNCQMSCGLARTS